MPGSIKPNKEIMMTQKKLNALPNLVTPNRQAVFNPDICIGCNRCVEVCQVDVYIPNPVKGDPPIILHPDECPGAINFNWPLQQRGSWKDKVTGKVHRDNVAFP
jgi:ferredoxin